jgi:hypothetical protein
MGIPQDERIRRRALEITCQSVSPTEVTEADEIRSQALAAFTAQLEGKIRNLQIGERLVVRFGIDIVGVDGKVRGGSGAERNMPAYAAWRKAVYERDGYRCRECGAKGRLNAHHVEPWTGHPELRFDADNGLTLCEDCHATKHPHIRLVRAKKGRNPR